MVGRVEDVHRKDEEGLHRDNEGEEALRMQHGGVDHTTTAVERFGGGGGGGFQGRTGSGLFVSKRILPPYGD